MWTEGAIHELNCCFYGTHWDVFKASCADLDELTFTVSSFITVCEQMIIPYCTVAK